MSFWKVFVHCLWHLKLCVWVRCGRNMRVNGSVSTKSFFFNSRIVGKNGSGKLWKICMEIMEILNSRGALNPGLKENFKASLKRRFRCCQRRKFEILSFTVLKSSLFFYRYLKFLLSLKCKKIEFYITGSA